MLRGLHTKYICYIAENFFPTARALIGYFDVTWHLAMNLFPTKSLRRNSEV